MATFVSKRVFVEAQQWFPPGDPRHDPAMFNDSDSIVKPGDVHRSVDGFSVSTPSGSARLNPGDWIVTGPRTDIVDRYPCDPVTFAAKYERHRPPDQPDIG